MDSMVIKMTFEPSGDLEQPYVFEQCVVGGAVPKNYFPAVEKGVQEAVLKGPMAAYPVVGVKAVLYDGSFHPVDSSEMAFKVAAMQAFKKDLWMHPRSCWSRLPPSKWLCRISTPAISWET